jgi:hypothetical protein
MRKARIKKGDDGKLVVTVAAQDGGDEETFPAVYDDQESIMKLRDKLIELGAAIDEDSSLVELVDAALAMLEDITPAEGDGGDGGGEPASAASGALAVSLREALSLPETADAKAIASKVDTLIVASARLPALEASVKELTEKDQKRTVDALMEQAYEAGVNPNDKKACAALRRLALSNREDFDAMVASFRSAPPEGQLVEGGIHAGADKRTKLIAASVKEYQGDKLAQGGRLETYVNTDLEEAGLAPLTETEIKTLKGE